MQTSEHASREEILASTPIRPSSTWQERGPRSWLSVVLSAGGTLLCLACSDAASRSGPAASSIHPASTVSADADVPPSASVDVPPIASTRPRPVCGNDVLESGEDCDDGNREDGDGCSRFCHDEPNRCGDGTVNEGEQCDPPDEGSCSATCQHAKGEDAGTTPVCGNATQEPGEDCDDGNLRNGDGCDEACRIEMPPLPAVCGNDKQESGEACDDGNLTAGDGCEPDCTPTPPPPPAYACGNNVLDTRRTDPRLAADEECDDGNLLSGDGCSGACMIESRCGDSNVTGIEECDDPDDEYCSVSCKVIHWCGNGVPTGSEECDDGNDVPRDGCTNCKLDGECGNGLLDWDEQCDGAFGIQQGGFCNPLTCQRMGGPGCGNGVVDPGEECDDGNRIDSDRCLGDCSVNPCGNGALDTGEWCDTGVTCFATSPCGDGVRAADEDCDDHNTTSGDGCSASCKVEPLCGDGVRDLNEPCDDGNVNDADGCSSQCQNEAACGNGNVEAGEECDDTNVDNGDSCSSRCRAVLPAQLPRVGSGCTNLDFDANTSCWQPRGQAVTLAHSSVDANGTPSSGSLAVMFDYVSAGVGVGAAGAGSCFDVTGGGRYSASASYLVDASQPASAHAMLALVEYAGARCSGQPGQPVLLYGNTRGAWAPLSVQLASAGNTQSVELRLFTSRDFADAPATILFDAVSLTAAAATCGNGWLEDGEDCDDGNLRNGDGCDASCTNDAVCGDGFVSAGEDCEDGNFANGDGCSSACRSEAACGNGVLEGLEECDDANTVNGDACTDHCRAANAFCGDGNVDPGEECDSGISCDGSCTASCTLPPVCGDGVREGIVDTAGAEECDDGNRNDGDGCNHQCRKEGCGDGVVQVAEECDDNGDTDYCTIACGLKDPVFDGCGACSQKYCQAKLDACENMTGRMLTGPGAGLPLATLCSQTYACRAAYQKYGDSAYCGDDCQAPDGPCKELIERAAGTTDPRRILEVLHDPMSVNGVAMALATCTANNCGLQCSGRCGNGRVEADEQCDDVALADSTVTSVPFCPDGTSSCGKYCAQGCQLASCGDHITTHPVEDCDGQADCDATCHYIYGVCGDGVINTNPTDNENCEALFVSDGGASAGNTADSGFSDAASGEGGVSPGVFADSCNPSCCRNHPVCGNGEVEQGCADDPVEECELGTPGCDSNCHFQEDSCEGCLAQNCSGPDARRFGAFTNVDGQETLYDLFVACSEGVDVEGLDLSGAPVSFAAAQFGQLCDSVWQCLHTPLQGQAPVDFDYFEYPFTGLFWDPLNPGSQEEFSSLLAEWFRVYTGNIGDATGPCRDVIARGSASLSANGEILNNYYSSLYPAGAAISLAICERGWCAEACGVRQWSEYF